MFTDEMDFGLTTAQTEGVTAVLQQLALKKAALMADEMREMAASTGVRRMLRFSDGNGGEVQMQIHPFSYHYWGQRFGYQCWQDEQFKREYWRDNPEARIKNESELTTVIVAGAGGLASSGKKRFQKTYGPNSTEGNGGNQGWKRQSLVTSAATSS